MLDFSSLVFLNERSQINGVFVIDVNKDKVGN